MIDTIIFDLGGVVVVETPDMWKNIFRDMSNKFNINPELLESNMERYKSDIQVGKMKLSDFYQNVLNSVNKTDVKSGELVKINLDEYIKYSGEYDKEMLRLVDRLRQSYRVVCFTNTEPEIAEFNRKRGLFDYFERAFISSEMGTRKPDLKSYQNVLSELNIRPKQEVFIDNMLSYVNAAEKAGIRGILYQNISQLKKELSSAGINV
jgi:HAD superfamily hydrolase (TIGR01509 family)